MSEHNHGLADYCPHESVGHMCRTCRRLANAAAREALDGLATDLAVTSGYTEAEEVRDYRDAHYPQGGTDGR